MKVFVSLIAGIFIGIFATHFYFPGSDIKGTGPSLNEGAKATAAKLEAVPPATAEEISQDPKHNDASTPKPKSISPEKRRALEDLTEEDIEEWRKIRREKLRDFLKNNSEYWHSGYDADKSGQPGRLDLAIVRASLGKYECIIKYEIRETKIRSTHNTNFT
jgi:hypothetical protein